MDMPVGEISVIDDFASGTAAAAAGGTTTIVDFAVQQPGQSPAQTIAMWQGKLAAAPPLIDVGFHFALTDLTVAGAAEELAALPAQGITSFKLFMAYPGTLMVERSHDAGGDADRRRRSRRSCSSTPRTAT